MSRKLSDTWIEYPLRGGIERHPLSAAWGDLDAESYAALADDVREHGVLNPIALAPHPDRPDEYAVLDGWHRYRAAMDAQQLSVPAVRVEDQRQALDYVIAHNARRRHISALERATAVCRMVDWIAQRGRPTDETEGMTSAWIAESAGVGVRTVERAKLELRGPVEEPQPDAPSDNTDVFALHDSLRVDEVKPETVPTVDPMRDCLERVRQLDAEIKSERELRASLQRAVDDGAAAEIEHLKAVADSAKRARDEHANDLRRMTYRRKRVLSAALKAQSALQRNDVEGAVVALAEVR